MKNQALTPRNIVESKGKLSYNESTQAWGTLRFKSELIKKFHQLKEKRSRFTYRLVFYRNYEDFEKAVKEIVKKEDVLPILMWLEKESG